MIARQTIHLSLKLPESMKGDGFNVADAKDPSAWSEKWPTLCSYFGLKGTGPLEIKDGEEKLEVRKYINDHIDTWKELEKEHGLKSGVADSDLTFKGFEVRSPAGLRLCRADDLAVLPDDPIRLRPTVRYDKNVLHAERRSVLGAAQHHGGLGTRV